MVEPLSWLPNILPCSSSHHLKPWQGFDFLEFWAGKAMASTMVSHAGRAVCSLDIDYFKVNPEHPNRSNHYDVLTSSGFLCLRWKTSRNMLFAIFPRTVCYICIYIYMHVVLLCYFKTLFLYSHDFLKTKLKSIQVMHRSDTQR